MEDIKKDINIETKYCEWKYVDMGMFGFSDYYYVTKCGTDYSADKITIGNYCPNCGGKLEYR